MTNKNNTKLYDGAVELVFYPDSHRYQLVGQKTFLVSVTAATGVIDKSRFLMPWAVKLSVNHVRAYLDSMTGKKLTSEELYPILDEAAVAYEKVRDEAASIGTIVHQFAEDYAKFRTGLLDKTPEIDPNSSEQVLNGINAFLDWIEQHKVKFLEAERLLYSKKHEYAGLADSVAVVDGKTLLVDYKTGKGIYNEAYYQVAGYVGAYEEEVKVKLDGALILNFDKETGALTEENKKYISQQELKEFHKVFLNCLGIKKMEKELSKLFYAKR